MAVTCNPGRLCYLQILSTEFPCILLLFSVSPIVWKHPFPRGIWKGARLSFPCLTIFRRMGLVWPWRTVTRNWILLRSGTVFTRYANTSFSLLSSNKRHARACCSSSLSGFPSWWLALLSPSPFRPVTAQAPSAVLSRHFTFKIRGFVLIYFHFLQQPTAQFATQLVSRDQTAKKTSI